MPDFGFGSGRFSIWPFLANLHLAKFLLEFPDMAEFTQPVHVDYLKLRLMQLVLDY